MGCAGRGADELGMAVAAAAGVSITRAPPPLLSHLAVSLSPTAFWNCCWSRRRFSSFWRSRLRRLALVRLVGELLPVSAGWLGYGVLGAIVRCWGGGRAGVCVQESCQLCLSHDGVASWLYI